MCVLAVFGCCYGERTGKAVFGTHFDTVTETDVINDVKRFLNDIKL